MISKDNASSLVAAGMLAFSAAGMAVFLNTWNAADKDLGLFLNSPEANGLYNGMQPQIFALNLSHHNHQFIKAESVGQSCTDVSHPERPASLFGFKVYVADENGKEAWGYDFFRCLPDAKPK